MSALLYTKSDRLPLPSPPLYVVDSFGNIQQAKSVNEYYVAVALAEENITFRYQYDIRGGHWVSGGIVVDFVVYIPFAVPLEVDERYWHTDSSRERYREAIIVQYFRQPVIRLTGSETADVGSARSAIRRKL